MRLAVLRTMHVGFVSLGLTVGRPAVTVAQAPGPPLRAVVQLLAIGPAGGESNQACSGTGFFVDDEGYVVTNAHVFRDAERCLSQGMGAKIIAKLPMASEMAGNAVSCDLVARDEVHDLVVLKTRQPLPKLNVGAGQNFLELDPSPVSEGEWVSVTGHPRFAWEPQTQSGRVVGYSALRLSTDSTDRTKALVIDVPLQPGSSGSPVYRAGTWSVVAVVHGQDRLRPSLTLAVPVRHAIEVLDRLNVPWHAPGTPGPTGQLKPALP